MALAGGVFLTGIYGGYFGAAQGVILIALLAIFLADDLQRLNGLKNVLAALINGVAAVLFILAAPVDYRRGRCCWPSAPSWVARSARTSAAACRRRVSGSRSSASGPWWRSVCCWGRPRPTGGTTH